MTTKKTTSYFVRTKSTTRARPRIKYMYIGIYSSLTSNIIHRRRGNTLFLRRKLSVYHPSIIFPSICLRLVCRATEEKSLQTNDHPLQIIYKYIHTAGSFLCPSSCSPVRIYIHLSTPPPPLTLPPSHRTPTPTPITITTIPTTTTQLTSSAIPSAGGAGCSPGRGIQRCLARC